MNDGNKSKLHPGRNEGQIIFRDCLLSPISRDLVFPYPVRKYKFDEMHKSVIVSSVLYGHEHYSLGI